MEKGSQITISDSQKKERMRKKLKKEAEKQRKLKKAAKLRKQGLTLGEIGEKMGVTTREAPRLWLKHGVRESYITWEEYKGAPYDKEMERISDFVVRACLNSKVGLYR